MKPTPCPMNPMPHLSSYLRIKRIIGTTLLAVGTLLLIGALLAAVGGG